MIKIFLGAEWNLWIWDVMDISVLVLLCFFWPGCLENLRAKHWHFEIALRIFLVCKICQGDQDVLNVFRPHTEMAGSGFKRIRLHPNIGKNFLTERCGQWDGKPRKVVPLLDILKQLRKDWAWVKLWILSMRFLDSKTHNSPFWDFHLTNPCKHRNLEKKV